MIQRFNLISLQRFAALMCSKFDTKEYDLSTVAEENKQNTIYVSGEAISHDMIYFLCGSDGISHGHVVQE